MTKFESKCRRIFRVWNLTERGFSNKNLRNACGIKTLRRSLYKIIGFEAAELYFAHFFHPFCVFFFYCSKALLTTKNLRMVIQYILVINYIFDVFFLWVLAYLFAQVMCNCCRKQHFSKSDDRVDKASACGTVDSGLISQLGRTNEFKIDIPSFPARRSTSNGQYGEQTGKFTCCAVGKST